MSTLKRYFFLDIAFLAIIFSSINTHAQMAWKWGRTASAVSESYPVAADNMGNVYAAGINTESTAAVFDSVSVPATGYQSVWVKYSSSGEPLWADGIHAGNANIYNITTDTSGNLIIFGNFLSATMQIGTFTLYDAGGPGNIQYFLAKVSPSGTVLWAINDGAPYYDFSDDFYSGLLRFGDVATDDSGNIYITSAFKKSSITIGSFTLTNTSSAGTSTDIFIAKYTPSGTLVWAKSAGGSANEYAFGITTAPGGNVYITGAFRSPSITFGTSVISNSYTNPRAYIAAFSSAGVPLWAQAAGGSRGAYSVGVKHDNDGNIYMAGSYADTSISFGAVTLTRGYPIAVPALAAFLVQYSSANVAVWSRAISSAAADVAAYSLSVTSCGAVWISGTCNHDIVAGPGDTLHVTTTPSDFPIYIAGYDYSGTVIGYSGLDVGGDDECDVSCDALGNVYLGGDFEGTLVTGPDVFVGSSSPSEHFFAAKYGYVIDTFHTNQYATTCVSDSSTITAPAGYSHYFWDDGETTQTRAISAPGNYLVFAVACAGTVLADTFHVSIGPDSIFSGVDTSMCIYSDLSLSIILTASAGSNYLWFNGDSTISDTVYSTGNYWVKYKNGCISEFDTFHVAFNDPPSAISGADTVCPGDSSVFTDIATGGIWNSSASAIASIDSVTGIAVGVSAGSFVITYTASSGCYTTKSVIVNAAPCVNSVPEVSNNRNLTISPNPATDVLTIQMGNGAYTAIEIVNNMGQALITQPLTGAQSKINIATLPVGIYYIRLTGVYNTQVVRLVKI